MNNGVKDEQSSKKIDWLDILMGEDKELRLRDQEM